VLDFDSLLVPIDFSPICDEIMDQAIRLASGEEPLVILLHVLDESLAEFAASHALGEREQVLQTMKQQAEAAMAQHKQRLAALGQGRVDVQTIITEGIPFLEILRKSEEFQVGAILLGKQSGRGGIERLLFGSTAERIIRGSRRPVLVLPVDTQQSSPEPGDTTLGEDVPRAHDVGG